MSHVFLKSSSMGLKIPKLLIISKMNKRCYKKTTIVNPSSGMPSKTQNEKKKYFSYMRQNTVILKKNAFELWSGVFVMSIELSNNNTNSKVIFFAIFSILSLHRNWYVSARMKVAMKICYLKTDHKYCQP